MAVCKTGTDSKTRPVYRVRWVSSHLAYLRPKRLLSRGWLSVDWPTVWPFSNRPPSFFIVVDRASLFFRVEIPSTQNPITSDCICCVWKPIFTNCWLNADRQVQQRLGTRRFSFFVFLLHKVNCLFAEGFSFSRRCIRSPSPLNMYLLRLLLRSYSG